MQKGNAAVRGLLARNALPGAIGIALAMAVCDLTLWLPRRDIETLNLNFLPGMAFGLAVIGLTLLLSLRGLYRAKNDYTIARLRVDAAAIRRLQTVQNTICYLLLWAVQAGLGFAFAAWYMRLHPDAVHENTRYLAFYRAPLAHNLLPLGDWAGWARMILFTVSLGTLTAAPGKGLVGKLLWSVVVVLWLGLDPEWGMMALQFVLTVVVIVVSLAVREEADDEEV